MFAFLKAIALGIVLSFVLSLFIGSGGSAGGMLNVFHVDAGDIEFYWSWPLFLVGTGLSFGIFLMMDQ
jgi:hypothetical protein